MLIAVVAALASIPTRGEGAAVPAVRADLHLDTPSQVLLESLALDAQDGLEAGVPRLEEGGTNLAVMVLWPGGRGVSHRTRTFALLERMEAEITRLDGVHLVRSPADARRVAARGELGVLFALEGAHGLGADWRGDLAELHERGLAMLGLTWSTSNRFAGSSGDGGGGLTEDGRLLIREAQRLGMLVDLSHASDATAREVCLGSPVPVVASHSGARAVLDHPRNLSDSLIRCIAESGGVVGLNLHGPFLRAAGADAAAAARHATHLREVGGPGVVALGSDYDGWIKTPTDLPHAGALPLLWRAMAEAGLSDDDIRAARGENFLRAWERAQTSARP